MIQLTPHMRILVATDPADFRRGIDGLACLCRTALKTEPLEGAVFVFRNRSRTAVKILVYDGQGFWLCHKRFSDAKFRHWPNGQGPVSQLEAHQLQVLLCGGDPTQTGAPPPWRRVDS
ncbi:IS66 family insertion sequence element accessory protein TnpB [bacterium]|nr:IS66 family insertion sequence element accessory protein TnpB [bacterium]